MKFLILIYFSIILIVIQSKCNADILITETEASLPPLLTSRTRSISRGPSIKLLSPENNFPTLSPFNFVLTFETHDNAMIDINSVNIIYCKKYSIDLTGRLKPFISKNGITFLSAEAPPGSHDIKVSVKDTNGRETNTLFTLVIIKR